MVACGGSSSSATVAPSPSIELSFNGGSWAAKPVNDNLDRVSNNGAGYTGEVDVFDIEVPATGRLQVSLYWEHEADYDVILASDPTGHIRLAEGIETDQEPEYVGIDVVSGQKVHALIAGWEGEPGPYVLEIVLLPPDAPVFDFTGGPDLDEAWPANRPMTFSFNVELDPDQDLSERVYLVGQGRVAEGSWCIDGTELTFYPRLPVTPDDIGGLEPDMRHTLQFRRAAHGVRAITGEYLNDLVGAVFDVAAPVDADPSTPPRVEALTPPGGASWDGSAIVVTLSEPVAPETLVPVLFRVTQAGPVAIDYVFALEQGFDCDGAVATRLSVAPNQAILPGTYRLQIPGTVLPLGGHLGLTGAEPAEPGLGFAVDFDFP